MAGRNPRLHLPYTQWPAVDPLLWERATDSDDPFADGAGARLAKASRHDYLFAWRRFLGFLAINEPTALEIAPTERPKNSGKAAPVKPRKPHKPRYSEVP
jgi:hypothetical protein